MGAFRVSTEALLLACAVPAWSLALDFVDVDLGADVLSFNAVSS